MIICAKTIVAAPILPLISLPLVYTIKEFCESKLWVIWSLFSLISNLFNAMAVLGGTHYGGTIKMTVLLNLAILRPNFFSNWNVRFFNRGSCLDWAGFRCLLMIVLYNWLKAIRGKNLLPSLSSLKLTESKKSQYLALRVM